MDILYYFTDHPIAFYLMVGFISLFIGSFLNVVIYRLPRMMEQSWNEECRLYLGLKPQQDPEKLNLSVPLSHCPRCKEPIRPWHNIPLLSYLFLRGKCAHCKTHISGRYPLVEFLTCITSLFFAYKFGFTWQCLAVLIFTWYCICLTFIDIDTHLLPDQLTLSLLWIGLFISIYHIFCDSQSAILGAMGGYLIFAFIQLTFEFFTGKTGMGQGDFKFLAAIGAFLGWQMLPLIILLSSISGVIIGLTHMALKRDFTSVPLPFGPYLAIAAWFALIWGSEIMQSYLSMVYP
jgi:leader peptidase (prepilin peptidase) / N-methyltransferase